MLVPFGCTAEGRHRMRNVLLISAVLVAFVRPCIAASKTYRFKECGVDFDLLSNWSVTLDHSETATRDSHLRCAFALRPNGWKKVAKASRWDANETPLWLMVFTPSTSFEEALAASGFEKDTERNRFGVPGGYGSFGEAEPFRTGNRSGLVAFSFFRGFIRDEAKLQQGESRVFSGEVATIVLRGDHSRPFAFECDGGTPDEPVDCPSVIERISATLQFTGERP